MGGQLRGAEMRAKGDYDSVADGRQRLRVPAQAHGGVRVQQKAW